MTYQAPNGRAPLAMTLALVPGLALGAFPGRPLLIGAVGDAGQTAWVAYENGDVLYCKASDAGCRKIPGLPAFARPVSLSTAKNGSTAWIGWSDGSLYVCQPQDGCRVVYQPDGPR